MGILHIIRERGGDELSEYRKALKMARQGIDTICRLSDDMADEYSERSDYGDRYGYRSREYPARPERDWDSPRMDERRYRDGLGRYY